MKQLLLYLLPLASLLITWSNGVAQPPAPTAVSGRVLGYLSNRIGDYDGLRLRTASGEVHLHFPPHTAAKVRQLATVGKLIRADARPRPERPRREKPDHEEPGQERPDVDEPGRERPAQEKQSPEAPQPLPLIYELVRIQNQASGTVVKIADLPPPAPQSGRLVQTEGPLVGDLHDDGGQLVGLLTDRYIIELKPHQCEQISSLLVGVHRLGVVGYERPADGFVNRSGRPLIHPTALTIRGQTFSL